MKDFSTVTISGAFKLPKCRAIWKDGLIRMYDKTGRKIMEAPASKPTRIARFRNAWESATDSGIIQLRSKCMTCGGWWAAARQKAEVLWSQ